MAAKKKARKKAPKLTKAEKARAKKAGQLITAAEVLQRAKSRFNKSRGPKLKGMCHFRA